MTKKLRTGDLRTGLAVEDCSMRMRLRTVEYFLVMAMGIVTGVEDC